MDRPAGPSDPRRRAVRHVNNQVTCPLGEVEDLSASGVRLACRGKSLLARGERCTLRLRGLDGALDVHARVAWIRKKGFRRYTIGLEFVDLKPAVRRALASLAAYGHFTDEEEPTSRRPSKKRPAPLEPVSVVLPDLYDMLGVEPHATTEEINRAYRALARTVHPDLNPDEEAATRFIRIRKAVAILRDPALRKQYDDRRAMRVVQSPV